MLFGGLAYGTEQRESCYHGRLFGVRRGQRRRTSHSDTERMGEVYNKLNKGESMITKEQMDDIIEMMSEWNFKFDSNNSSIYLEHYAPNLENAIEKVADANNEIAYQLQRIADVFEKKETL